MNEVDYIYEFLHDPDKHRWPQPVVDYLLQAATDDITSKVEAFLKLRDINRERAQLKQLGTHDETVTIQLVEGIDVYDLPEDFLRISSVIYEGCFIPHQIPGCNEEIACGEDRPSEIVRSYNASGLPKGKVKISPVPAKWTKECITTECKTVTTSNSDLLYGWGLWNIPAKCSITQEEHEVVTTTELTLGKMEITYEVADTLDFTDDAVDALATALADKQLKKFYVCGHLLRDDKDSHSRTLGAEELKLYDDRLTVLLGKYTELYDVDNTLELASADEGYVDTKTNETIVRRDAVDIEKERLKELKEKQVARNGKSKFDTLGTR